MLRPSFLRPLVSASPRLSHRLLRRRILRSRLRAAYRRRLYLPLSTPSVIYPSVLVIPHPGVSLRPRLLRVFYLSTAVVYPSFVTPPPIIPFAPSSTLRVFVSSSAVVYVQLVHAIVCLSLSMPSISATFYPFVLVSPPRLRLCPRLLQVFVYSVSYALRGRLRYYLPVWRYLQHCGHLLHCHRRHLSSKPSSLFTKVPVVQLAPNAVVWAKAVYLAGSRIDSTYFIASVPPTTSDRSRSDSGRELAYRK